MSRPYDRTDIAKVGTWSALVALAGAVGYIVSVPLQVLDVVSPSQDSILAFVSSLIIATPFLLAMLALHYVVPEEKRFWTHAAVLMAVIYATYNTLNYVVQLATVLPAGYTWTFEDQQGTVGPLSLLNQTPHSLFWDIDGLGYIFLNVATLLAAQGLDRSGAQRWVRRFFLANGLITPVFAIAYFYPTFSVPLLMIGGVPWAITVPGCLLSLALFFHRTSKVRPHASETIPVARGRGQRPRGQLDPTRQVATGICASGATLGTTPTRSGSTSRRQRQGGRATR